jgi:hypothetical protein
MAERYTVGHSNVASHETDTTTAIWRQTRSRYAAAKQCDNIAVNARSRGPRPNHRATEMECEEALLRVRGGDGSAYLATYYRRKAARARQVAEGVTTRAIEARLLDEALRCDQLAADVDRVMEEPIDL